MLERQLPMYPEGVTHINNLIGFEKRDGKVTYFNGHMPIFSHDEKDIVTFRMITAQFCVQGNAKQAEISRVFGVPSVTVKRAVKRYREKGPKGFYEPRVTRGSVVLTDDVLVQAQRLLDEGKSNSEISTELDVKADTLRKAILSGRLRKAEKKTPQFQKQL